MSPDRALRPLRILTWHVHGSYLLYLSRIPHEIVVPAKPGRPHRYGGLTDNFTWPANLREVPADEVRDLELDAILFQTRANWDVDQFEILSEAQRRLPRLYLEHDPPREHPTDTRHWVDDPEVLLVHVTHFNDLMWDSGRTPTRVVEHGVVVTDEIEWTGDLPRAVTVINDLATRGRRLGRDVFERVRAAVPVDLIGIDGPVLGGREPLPLADMPPFLARYRCFFNPIRYTSLGLAVLEAMAVGLPIVGLATTEMARAVENGVNGWIDTDVKAVERHLRRLLTDRDEAAELSRGARRIARERFGIERFARDWDAVLREATGRRSDASPIAVGAR